MRSYIILFFMIFFFAKAEDKFQQKSICKQIVENRKRFGTKQNQEFKQLIKKLSQVVHDQCFVQLTPKYYWAQNMSFVMVKFDFQMSSQTSPCSQLLYSEKNISYNGFYIKLFCFQSDLIVKYQLQVKTFKNLNFHHSQWKSTEMNGLIMECMKSPMPYFWPKLYSGDFVPTKKPRIWWQIQQKQDQQVQKFMSLLQIDESEIEISNKVKKMRKTQTIYNFDNSDIQFYCNEGSPYFQGSWF